VVVEESVFMSIDIVDLFYPVYLSDKLLDYEFIVFPAEAHEHILNKI
jgi:hypothetical protein